MIRVADLFAGWGGFTLGAEQAGAKVVYAANHWPLAVEAHAQNHPHTTHVCQDLRQADWTTLPPFDLLVAGPACQGHSSASRPKRRRYHNALRATAWAVVDCVEATRPKGLVVENVREFLDWKLFPRWRQCLEDLGYSITAQLLWATSFGVPQRRRRLFIVGSQGDPVAVQAPRRAEPAFGPCIDWAANVPWTPVTKSSAKVQARIAKGRASHGERFLTQHVTNHPGVSLTESIRTITTGDQWAVVDGSRYRPLTIRENARAMGFPDDYSWPSHAKRKDCIRGLGNAVPPPMARGVVAQVGGAL